MAAHPSTPTLPRQGERDVRTVAMTTRKKAQEKAIELSQDKTQEL